MNGAAKPKKPRQNQRPKINNTKAAIKRLPPLLSQENEETMCIPLKDPEYPPHSEFPGKKPCH
jgi:hypothetical protein